MSDYTEYAGVEIDIATCSQCERQEVFDKPRELKCAIGDVNDRWKCILEDLEDPDETTVVCPDCTTDVEGFVYVL